MRLEHLIRQPSAATFPRWGRLVLYAPKVRLLFLTSTAFVDTKAKPRTMRGEIAISISQVVLSFLVLDALFLQR